MIKYTTPVLGLLVENRDLTGNDIYVSLEQGQTEATFSGSRLQVGTVTEDERTDTTIDILLTQEESAAFDFNKSVDVQVNWINVQVF